MASKVGVSIVQFFIFSQAPQETEVKAPPQETQAPPLDWNQLVEEEEKEKEKKAAKEPQALVPEQEELDAKMAEMTLEKK